MFGNIHANHIHITAIDCGKRYYDSGWKCVATRCECDVESCMTCKRARQYEVEENLRRARGKVADIV